MKSARHDFGMFLSAIALVTFASLLLCAMLSCGNSSRQSANPALTQSFQENTARTLSVEQAIEEAKTYSLPSDSNADPDVFEMLKNEFIKQLEELSQRKDGKLTSAAPAGDAGRVTDLTYSSVTGRLSWSYVNIGDYDCSGEVGVPDITPIALNYLAVVTTPGSLEDWIDGSGDNEVGISDITPIATGYLSTVKSYRIVTCKSAVGAYKVIGGPVDFGEPGVFPKLLNTTLPGGALAYIAVEPLDAAGNPGARSNVIALPLEPPSISNVNPLSGITGAQVQFTAEATGSAPFTYEWSFGGGATPDTSTDESPTVTLGATSNYNASVTLTNSQGSDTFDFVLSVTATAMPPDITQVTPLTGLTGAQVQFSATVSGTPPFTYAWNFGGGAVQNTSSDASPVVTLGTAGSYNASLTVTNAQGSDTFDFALDVTDTPIAPTINSVSPDSGATGTQAQFSASIDGTQPFTYLWDFGSGASPDTSSDSSPTVTLGSAGSYNASLTVTNASGGDTYNWNLNIGNPPSILDVMPVVGTAGKDVTFGATVSGDIPMTFVWDFGEGATPNISVETSPTVTMTSIAGSYNAVLAVSNAYGMDTFPFTLTVNPITGDGYTLFCPYTGTNDTYLIDMDGSLKHTWTSDYPPGACAKFRPNGNLVRLCNVNNPVFGGGKAGRVEERDWDDNVVWSYELSTDTQCFHHDFDFLPNGNLLLNFWMAYTKQDAIDAGRNPTYLTESGVWMAEAIEIQPVLPSGGNIVWEWNSFDHLVQDYDPSKPNYGDPAAHPELMDLNYGQIAMADWLHVNAIAYNPDLDQIVLTVNGISEIWVIDHSTTTEEAAGHTGGNCGRGGDILYRWGNPQVYGAGTSADRKLFFQHNSHWIADGLSGAGDIMIFNNQAGYPTGQNFSSVLQITPPLNPDGTYYMTDGVFGPETATWEYTSNPQNLFFSGSMSSSQRLPGGDTLICSAQQKWIFEVTPDGEVVWEYHNPYPPSNPGTVFSALRYPYDFPGFVNMP
jgi:PKD repeat protein